MKKKTTAPRFPVAHFVITLAAALFALASVAGNILYTNGLGFQGLLLIGAAALTGLLVFTLDMVSVLLAPAWARSKRKALGLGLVACVMVIGAGLQTNAINTVAAMPSQHVIADLNTKAQAVQVRIDALPTSQTVCEGHGPQNCAARQEGLKADRAALIADRDAYKLEAAALPQALPVSLIGFALMLFQVAMFFLRAWLTSVTVGIETEAKAQAEATALEKAKADLKKAKAELKTLKAKPKAAAAKPNPPYLAYANDG